MLQTSRIQFFKKLIPSRKSRKETTTYSLPFLTIHSTLSFSVFFGDYPPELLETFDHPKKLL